MKDNHYYAQNNGHLFVVGNPFRSSPVPDPKNRRPRTVALIDPVAAMAGFQ